MFSVLTIQVVLSVYASDCFTVAASTVGISSVLSTAKKVVLGLSEAREYQLMVSSGGHFFVLDSPVQAAGLRKWGLLRCLARGHKERTKPGLVCLVS